MAWNMKFKKHCWYLGKEQTISRSLSYCCFITFPLLTQHRPPNHWLNGPNEKPTNSWEYRIGPGLYLPAKFFFIMQAGYMDRNYCNLCIPLGKVIFLYPQSFFLENLILLMISAFLLLCNCVLIFCWFLSNQRTDRREFYTKGFIMKVSGSYDIKWYNIMTD